MKTRRKARNAVATKRKREKKGATSRIDRLLLEWVTSEVGPSAGTATRSSELRALTSQAPLLRTRYTFVAPALSSTPAHQTFSLTPAPSS